MPHVLAFPSVLAATITAAVLLQILLVASVIGLLLDPPWPQKPWRIVAAIALVVLAVILLVSG